MFSSIISANNGIIVENDGLIYSIDSINTASGFACTRLASYSLPTVFVPDSVSYGAKKYPVTAIGDSAFFYCQTVKKVVLPNTIESIGKYAFDLCSKMLL